MIKIVPVAKHLNIGIRTEVAVALQASGYLVIFRVFIVFIQVPKIVIVMFAKKYYVLLYMLGKYGYIAILGYAWVKRDSIHFSLCIHENIIITRI